MNKEIDLLKQYLYLELMLHLRYTKIYEDIYKNNVYFKYSDKIYCVFKKSIDRMYIFEKDLTNTLNFKNYFDFEFIDYNLKFLNNLVSGVA